MSWREFSIRRIKPLGAAAALTLAGCGFHPLYESGPSGVDSRLSHVRVEQMAGREGQLLTNKLRDDFNPHGVGRAAEYQLEVAVAVTHADLIPRPDGTPTRSQVSINAHWVLRGLTPGKPVLLDATSSAYNGHDIIETNDYANVVASGTDTDRCVEQVALDIEARLAGYFTSPR